MRRIFLNFALLLIAGSAAAQDAPSPGDIASAFGSEHGDAFSSVLLHEIFGPLFPAADGSSGATVFSSIIGYVNVFVLAVGGLMFFYNVTVGVLQSAHEGQVLGQRWSSLWAPLRVIFAVGLLVPIPGLGGYNLGQAGVAYLVRGATSAASTIWVATADSVISDDIPLAASAPSVDPGLLRDLYYNAGCMRLVQYQLDVASGYAEDNSRPRPLIGYHLTSDLGTADAAPPVRVRGPGGVVVERSQPSGRIAATTAVTGPDDRPARLTGICGGWETPEIPVYLTDLGADGAEVVEQFATGHAELIDGVAQDMSSLAGAHFDAAFEGRDVPDISGEVAAATRSANERLSEFVGEIREVSITASGGDDGRDLLLDRIRGDADCEGPDCLGEGWIGAGTWYITMARLNNRLSSVVEAAPETDGPELTYDRERLFEEAGGRPTGRRWLGIGQRQASEEDLSGIPTAQETTRILEWYHTAFIESAAKLAALGYPLAPSSVAEINADAADSVWDYIPGAQTLLTRIHGVMLGALEPGNFASDPMIGLTSIGKALIVVALALIGAVTIAGFATGGGLAVSLAPVIGGMTLAGITLAYLLPIMPFVFWILGVTGYLLTAIEAIIAVNLWALAHMRMDGDGISGEAGRRGWLLLLTLTFTPVLMIFGFIAGMIIFRVSDGLLSAGFFYAVEGIIGGNLAFGLFAVAGYAVFLAGVYIILLERSFSLITEFPQRVLRWIGESDQVSSATFIAAPVRPRPTGGAAPRAIPRGSRPPATPKGDGGGE